MAFGASASPPVALWAIRKGLRAWVDEVGAVDGQPVPLEVVAWVDAMGEAADYHVAKTRARLAELALGPAPADEVSTLVAARRLNATDRSVRRWIERGTLSARLVGRTWMVDAASVAEQQQRRAS